MVTQNRDLHRNQHTLLQGILHGIFHTGFVARADAGQTEPDPRQVVFEIVVLYCDFETG
jgi:hypothetical protein